MVTSTLTGRSSPGDASSRLRYKDQGGRYDSTPYSSPGGSGSLSYWGNTGTGPEHKYHYQKGAHGGFDELGYTEKIPQGGIAPFAQYESERIVAQRNARLMEQSRDAIGDARSNALGRMESYRPGGAAQLASGIDMQAGMGISNVLAASRTEAPDLLYQNRRDSARRSAQKARQMQYIQMGVQAVTTVAAAAATGGASLAVDASKNASAPGPAGGQYAGGGDNVPQNATAQGGQPGAPGGSQLQLSPTTPPASQGQTTLQAQNNQQGPQNAQGPQGPQSMQSNYGGGSTPGAPAAPGGGGGPTTPGPNDPASGPITPTGGPISQPSIGAGDPGDMSGARFLRDAQAEGVDLNSLRAMSMTQDEDDRDDYLGFLELWNADIDALMYAS